MAFERNSTVKTNAPGHARLIDTFGRAITYLRLSVTDRCDLRCTYCMSEHMTFLPRKDVLSLEETYRVAETFMRLGIRKLRLTGGEPLVRKNIMTLFAQLKPHLEAGDLDEVTLTTNGTLLARHAAALKENGVRRVNVSLDTLDPERYRAVTRWGDVNKVLAGIDAALGEGLAVKLNAVVQKGRFQRDAADLITFAHERGMDLTFIEAMPLGGALDDYGDMHLPLGEAEGWLKARYTLEPVAKKTGGPARFMRVRETGGLIGFIAPLSCNFCAACNRMRVSCTAQLFPCMGDDGAVDLRAALRSGEGPGRLEQAILGAVAAKPWGHGFGYDGTVSGGLSRPMSHLGG
ncbi:GTP 3',8-cyclase MoaA [Zhengella sp. ZM62]|uniref:GTP 3',8-cyclase MoaA n=1 Tax=Zhengella sedimenti TaxID=3390035 RepID=UPI0039756D83